MIFNTTCFLKRETRNGGLVRETFDFRENFIPLLVSQYLVTTINVTSVISEHVQFCFNADENRNSSNFLSYLFFLNKIRNSIKILSF